MLPRYSPMLATTSPAPVGSGGWAFEPKLDGWRAVVYVDDDVRVLSRRGRDLTASVPALGALCSLGHRMILDGELVAGDGRPGSFYRLAGEISSRRSSGAVVLAAFDLLWLDGEDLTGQTYEQRRARLEGLGLRGATWTTVPSFRATAEEVGTVCIEHGLEGMVAKRLDGRYRPGQRSTAWVKFKTLDWRERHAPNRHGVVSAPS